LKGIASDRFQKSRSAIAMSEPSSQSIAPVGGFIGQICAYFRDFLDTDFRKQRMPKRSIGLRDTKGNLTGISVAKYPELTSDLWRQLGKQLDANRQFSISIGRGKYHSRVNKTLLDVIEKHVSALKGEVLALLGDRIKVIGRELLEDLRNDPERYRETVVTSLRNDLIRTAVAPLTQLLESSIRRAGNDEFEVAYDIEDELGLRLVADAGEAIGSALATAIVEGTFNEFDEIIGDVIEPETIRRRLTT
jgi:hypothetical protein